jgi:hypothetical protein
LDIDPLLAAAAFGIGIVVGRTGMGGGALMTPVLVLFFHVPPLAAVSSDLVASAVMKPVGSIVHLRRGTVHLGLVKWLCIGSVPGAFSGVLIARAFGEGQEVQDVIRIALGVALLLAAIGLTVRAYLRLVERARRRCRRGVPPSTSRPALPAAWCAGPWRSSCWLPPSSSSTSPRRTPASSWSSSPSSRPCCGCWYAGGTGSRRWHRAPAGRRVPSPERKRMSWYDPALVALKALAFQFNPVAAVVLGIMTGVGGGVAGRRGRGRGLRPPSSGHSARVAASHRAHAMRYPGAHARAAGNFRAPAT